MNDESPTPPTSGMRNAPRVVLAFALIFFGIVPLAIIRLTVPKEPRRPPQPESSPTSAPSPTSLPTSGK